MFEVALHPDVTAVDGFEVCFADGTRRPLAPVLQPLAALTHDWQPVSTLERKGLATWQIERLFRQRFARIGKGSFTFPRRARCYFEEQFPAHSGAKPLSDWLCRPAPKTVWIGLPHANLVQLRHSTALGLADIIDTFPPGSAPLLGVLADQTPTARTTADLGEMLGLSVLCGFRLGLIGGDHRVAWSLLSGFKTVFPAIAIRYIHIDAHHDLYGFGKPGKLRTIGHANFLVDLLERGAVDQARLIGCRDREEPLRAAQAMGYDVACISDLNQLDDGAQDEVVHTHLSIDIDVLDPCHARAVSSPLGGGWTPERLFDTVAAILERCRVQSCSIVEAGSGCAVTTGAAVRLVGILGGSQ